MEKTKYYKLEDQIELRKNRLQVLCERGMEDEQELENLKESGSLDKDYIGELKRDIDYCSKKIVRINKAIQNLSDEQFILWESLNKKATRTK